jgi:hypothetical protein
MIQMKTNECCDIDVTTSSFVAVPIVAFLNSWEAAENRGERYSQWS